MVYGLTTQYRHVGPLFGASPVFDDLDIGLDPQLPQISDAEKVTFNPGGFG